MKAHSVAMVVLPLLFVEEVSVAADCFARQTPAVNFLASLAAVSHCLSVHTRALRFLADDVAAALDAEWHFALAIVLGA